MKPTATPRRNGETLSGNVVTYGFNVLYEGDGPTVDRSRWTWRLPSAIRSFWGRRLRSQGSSAGGRVASYDNITPGALGYTFNNYARVFKEARSITHRTQLVPSLDAQLVYHRHRQGRYYHLVRVDGRVRARAAYVSGVKT